MTEEGCATSMFRPSGEALNLEAGFSTDATVWGAPPGKRSNCWVEQMIMALQNAVSRLKSARKPIPASEFTADFQPIPNSPSRGALDFLPLRWKFQESPMAEFYNQPRDSRVAIVTDAIRDFLIDIGEARASWNDTKLVAKMMGPVTGPYFVKYPHMRRRLIERFLGKPGLRYLSKAREKKSERDEMEIFMAAALVQQLMTIKVTIEMPSPAAR